MRVMAPYESAYSKASARALLQSCQRERKHATTTGLESGMTQNPTLISVKIAALEALEALLTVGGALGSESWRSNVDHLLITVATNVCKGGWAKVEKNIFLSGEPITTWADLQLVALRILLASLLSPARVRLPYLAQGLELFRRGMRARGTRLAEFCAHDLLVLDLLIHPRDLPLVDIPYGTSSNSFDGVNRRFPENTYSSGQKQSITFPVKRLGKGPGDPESDDDHLFESWLVDDDELEFPVTRPEKNASPTEEPSDTFRDPLVEKLLCVDGLSDTKAPGGVLGASAAAASQRNRRNGEDIMVESQQTQETIKHFDEPVSHEVEMVATVIGGSMSAQLNSVVTESCELDRMDIEMLSGKDVLATEGDMLTTVGEKTSTIKSKWK